MLLRNIMAEQQYLDLIQRILDEGARTDSRNGVTF